MNEDERDATCHVLMLFITSSTTGKQSFSISPNKLRVAKSYSFSFISKHPNCSMIHEQRRHTHNRDKLNAPCFFFFFLSLGNLPFPIIMNMLFFFCLFCLFEKSNTAAHYSDATRQRGWTGCFFNLSTMTGCSRRYDRRFPAGLPKHNVI